MLRSIQQCYETTNNVERINYEESTVVATMSSETAAQSPAHNLPPAREAA